jgi:hypothetical protein
MKASSIQRFARFSLISCIFELTTMAVESKYSEQVHTCAPACRKNISSL